MLWDFYSLVFMYFLDFHFLFHFQDSNPHFHLQMAKDAAGERTWMAD